MINRPWRPLPSGKVTVDQAIILRKAVVLLCIGLSSSYGRDAVLFTVGLAVATFLYDEVGLSAHPVGKNFCNTLGYAMSQGGATLLMSKHAPRHNTAHLPNLHIPGNRDKLDSVSITAIVLSGATIFTTIQAQDFPDVEGDAAIGRMTLPIYAPRFARWFTLFATVAWSVFYCWVWGLGVVSSACLVLLGLYVGGRYSLLCAPEADRKSYVMFNVGDPLFLTASI